ncbi:protein phosphatase 1 regulatory subunit 3D [Bombina bombina]|uniref:protein phosphatase 1 regulatory subunit 3D n=1 Tax=Bombina bombina TaxID=8345 RepID=UPI00235AD0B7|nr:protein phosphatase 1 regulatory subunit 3D [Bombina bombina]
MSYKLSPFVTPLSFKEKVQLSIPRSLSYINNLYQNAQLSENFVQQETRITLNKDQYVARHFPRTQSTVIATCDPELRPIMRRRTKSLPTSPDRKTITKCRSRCNKVRFADSLGLELAEVKIFKASDDPSIPLHVLSRLSINSDLCCSQDLEFTIQYLEPDFKQPVDCGNFLDLLQQHCVCLEQATSSDETDISGSIRVLNLAFEKSVSVRYSFTDWKNYYEVGAVWQNSIRSESTDSDVFAFSLPLPPFLQQICSVIEVAIRYQVEDKEYWDNNMGNNYSFSYRSHTLKMPKECEQSWIHFI